MRFIEFVLKVESCPRQDLNIKRMRKLLRLLLTMKKRNHPTPKRNVKRIDVRNVIYVIYDIYDMYGALTYTNVHTRRVCTNHT